MSEECCNKERRKSRLAGASATLGAGLLANTTICPCIPGLMLKAGLISAGVLAPFEATNRYLVDKVTPVVSSVRGDERDYSTLPEKRYDRKTRDLVFVDPNREIASDIVDYAGWIVLASALAWVGYSMYKSRNRKSK
jgi:hypothetical protein